MNRFVPDTVREALMRPVAMAAPDGWVYTEIVAPDFRFALVLVLAVLLALGWKRARLDRARRGPLFALGALIAMSFVPWLATSGNGRYFIAHLILIGPVCIALVAMLPGTRSLRAFALLFVMAAQAFAVSQNNPWKPFDTWEWIAWKEPPYFHVDTAPVRNETDVTYVTLSVLTMSLIAPQFPPGVRWVNLSAFDGMQLSKENMHYQPVREMLSQGRLKVLQRVQVRAADPRTGAPDDTARAAMNAYLAPHGLALREPHDCVFLRSRNLSELTTIMSADSPAQRQQLLERAGFWSCSLVRIPPPAPPGKASPQEEYAVKVFERLEALCPRFFAPGQERITLAGTAFSRAYPATDSFLLLAEDDQVYVKYLRALNPQRLGLGREILEPGFRLDCHSFTGRGGLPWERKI